MRVGVVSRLSCSVILRSVCMSIIIFLWHGVVSAGIPWVAAKYAFDGEPCAPYRAVAAQRFYGILAAGWNEPA